jgi:hypothetical protein
MSPAAYRAALDEALREYERLTADRAGLDARIGQLQQTIGMLTRLCGLSPTVPMGLSDACRLVLRGARAPMTAIQVRERLEAIGMLDPSKYANPLAVIHTTLKRLEESGEAWATEFDESNKTGYQLMPSQTRTPLAPRVIVVKGSDVPKLTSRRTGKGGQK